MAAEVAASPLSPQQSSSISKRPDGKTFLLPPIRQLNSTQNVPGHVLSVSHVSHESPFGGDVTGMRSQEEAFRGLLQDIDVKSEKQVQVAHDTDEDFENTAPI